MTTSYIDGLRSATSASSGTSATTTAGSGSTLGMSDFLKLLTTQMQTQDPFNPVDNTQMVAQMAQFSSVAGISSMNSTLSGIASNLNGNRIGDAASWIGKSVLVSSGTAAPLADGSFAGRLTLPSDASEVNLSFVDATGKTVHSESLGARQAGSLDFAWDGKDADGAAVAGPVTIKASATGASGTVTPSIAAWASVTGVQSPAGGADAALVTSLGLVAPTDALALS